MIKVSQKFKESVYAPTRKTTAKVFFEILDNEAYNDNTSTVTSEAPISRKHQLTNKKRNMSHRYATFERDYFKLDGSFHIPPKPHEGDSELGWWSGDICNEEGIFNPYQVLEFNFTEEHNSMGLTITFDTMANEYASDFDIEVYGLDGTLIHKEVVTNNNYHLYVLIRGLDNYGKIKIIIKKWAKPFRRVRITEVDFGVVKNYEDDKLIKLNIIEQMNIISDTIPSNEIKFTIDNSSKEFNILNPEGFYRFLKERQEVTAAIGVEIREDEFEYVPMGKFYLTDWQSDEGAMTTTFTARDIFELLDQKEYVSITDTNLYDLAEDVLVKAEVKNYYIDEELKNINTLSFEKKLNSRKALQYIGIAGKAAIYQDRQGVLQIKQFKILDERDTQYIYFTGPDMFAGMIYVATDEGYDMKNITFDNVYKEPQIKLDKLVYSIVMVINEEEKQEVTFYNEGIKEGVSFKIDNPLINTVKHAQEVAEWIIEEYNLRAIYNINWRQNPALECGDIVLVEDSFNAKKLSRIIKQEFNYQGYLNGKTETKGGI
ncbi:hypothetical protein KQI42_15930 [Tissierella sp. MSJ-40]|uniref:Uncharacterized protein n=1 Tax=Tissierella simiarum TaxID=2841534 RepID=A0ABS6E9A2_9FIRM|nr:hypothetical protein [Tissierella simiarum]MBU5439505.1 hypothetical protein [Tissierella simiarum]